MTLSGFDDLALETVSIPIGGREWHLDCVRDQGRVLAYAESHAQAPYGLLLWESAVALARSLHTHSTLVENKQVLELGAGVGLPGLVARSLGAEVWQTDNLTAALEIARLNARANEVSGITRFTADWARWTDDRLWDRTFYTSGRCKGRSSPSSAEILHRMALYYLRIQRGSSLSIYWHV